MRTDAIVHCDRMDENRVASRDESIVSLHLVGFREPPATILMRDLPRPTGALVVLSVLVILFSIWVSSLATAGIVMTFHESGRVPMFGFLSGLIVLMFTLPLGVQQYLGTFRSVEKCCFVVTIILFLLALLLGLSCIAALMLDDIRLSLILLSLTTTLVVAACLNYQWHVSLLIRSNLMPNSVGDFSLKELLLCVTVAGLILGGAAYYVDSAPPDPAHIPEVSQPIVDSLLDYHDQNGRFPESLEAAGIENPSYYGGFQYQVSKGGSGCELEMGDYMDDGFCVTWHPGQGWYIDQ